MLNRSNGSNEEYSKMLQLLGLALAAMVIAGVAWALIGSISFLRAHPLIRVVVVPIVVLVSIAVAILAGKHTVTSNWEPIAKKLAPWARNADPLKEKLSPFNTYAAYAPGFERYLSLSPDERKWGATDAIDRVARLPDHLHWGIWPGTNRYNMDLAMHQSDIQAEHRLDNDATAIAFEGASLNAVLRQIDSEAGGPDWDRPNPDLFPAELFLGRLAHQGNRTASRDLALLLSKEKPEPVFSLTEYYSCRGRMKRTFHLPDTDCDRYDPYKGSGLFGYLYRVLEPGPHRLQ